MSVKSKQNAVMKPKTIFFLVLLFLIHPSVIYSQGLISDLKSITQPNVASLIKSVNYPVNEYNGLIDISVDVLTIKDGEVEIPVNLSYNSSGIKVEEEASWVGLGWSLSGDGVIAKQIIGEEDNYTSYHSINTDDLFPTSPSDHYEPDNYNPYSTNNHLVYDNAFLGAYKPDIYSYNFGGYSGRFYIDMRTEIAYQINPATNICFEKINSSPGYENWKATTEDGSSYYFTLQTVTSESIGGKIVERAFHLTEVVISNGQRINYYYTDLGQSISSPYNSTSVEGKLTYFFTSDIREIIAHNSSGAIVLNKITTENLEVEFHSSPRLDVDKDQKLDSIVVKDRNTSITRTFLFNYEYFTSPVEGNYWTGNLNFFNLTRASKRLKLLSVKEKGLPQTTFEYNTTLLPLKTSYAVDYWGYYNGKTTNNSLLPNLHQLQYDDSDINDNMLIFGACRATDISKCGACMLSSIQLPTGGKTIFSFEPNTFSNHFYPDVTWIEENDVITGTVNDIYINDQNNSGDISTYCFDLANASEIRISRSMSRGLDNWSNLNGSYIFIVKVEGSNVTPIEKWILEYPMIRRYAGQTLIENEYVISYSGETPMIYSSEFITTLPAGRYCVSASLPDNLGDQYGSTTNHSNVFAHIYVPEQSGGTIPNKSNGAGLRIAKIQYYENNSIGASTFKGSVFYDYNDPVSGISNGVLMSGLQYYREYNGVRYLKGNSPTGCCDGCCVSEFMQNEYSYNGNTVIPISFAAKGGLVGYSFITKHYEDFGAVYTGTSNYLNGSVRSYFFNNPSFATYGVPDLPNCMNGELSKQEFLNSSGTLVKTINYSYDEHLIFNSFYGLHVDSYWYRNPLTVQYALSAWPACCSGMSLIIPYQFPGRYKGVFYPLRSEKFKMSKIVTLWPNGLTYTNQYDYNEYGQLTTETALNSKSEEVTTIYTYPSTYNGSDLTLIEMKNKHVWSTPISIVKMKSGNTIYSETNSLSKIGSATTTNDMMYSVYKISTKQIAPTGTSVNKRTFYEYASNRLKSMNDEYDKISAFLWGYNNTYPIANVENTVYSDIAYTGFEDIDYGGWTYQSGTRSTSYARTGRYSCVNAILQKTVSVNSIISLWVKSGGGTPSISGYTPKVFATTDGWIYYEWNVPPGSFTVYGTNCYIDDLRLYPVGAMMTTYTYDPLVGMTSATDPNGIITRYEYDSYGRLKQVRDNDGNITGRNYYHYYNDPASDTPYLNTSPTSLAFGSGSSSSTFSISSNVAWSITDNASWLSVNTTSGTGDATVSVSVTANTSAARNATITITYAGGLTKTITVSQAAGSTSTLLVSPMTINFASIASSQTVTITSNTSWTVTKSDSWIIISATSGTGNGTVRVGAIKLLSGTRSGSVTFKTTDNIVTRIINVYQDAGLMQQ